MTKAIIKTGLIAFSVVLSGLVYAADYGAKKAVTKDEPTVSAEEAKLLSQVAEITKKSMSEAALLLKPEIKANSSAALDFALGNIRFQQNEFKAAEKAYQRALVKMDSFRRARANLARVLVQQDRIEEAIMELKSLLLEGTPKPSTLTLLGYTYLLKEDAVAAESSYRLAIMYNPKDVNAQLGLVKALFEQERYQESVKLLEKVIRDYPYRGELWALLANGRMSLDNTAGAASALESARRLKVISNEGLSTLGDLLLNRNQPKQALTVYKQAFSEKTVDINRLLRAIDGFLMAKEITYVSDLIKKAQQLNAVNKLTAGQANKLYWQLARKADLEGDKNKALKAYKRVLKKVPLHGKALMAIGDLYRNEKAYEQAAIAYERVARIGADKVNALIRLAQLSVERSRYQDARHYLEEAQSLKPQTYVADYLEQVKRLVR
ncbi:tetratricopeptide repeat protein [bacterium]|nr:tetratricopeptide repeat protein [bacterium]